MTHALKRYDSAPRSITVLGSTGSIGISTLDVLACHEGKFQLSALTAQDNATLLAKQATACRAKRAVIGNENKYLELKSALAGTGIEVAAGSAAIIEAATMPADIVIAAIVGNAGLLPTLAAIRRGATVALANKECLVCAGALMTDEVKRAGATLLPVDSEHSAIFQVFDFKQPDSVEKIILTASGGPFRGMSAREMADVTCEQALKHPNWSMGAKITIDSATMMNKALECIEAYYLFPLKPAQIEVLVHPESIIHGMVCYKDGSVLAQMGSPDMRTPIAHALAWPERINAPSPRLDFSALKNLTFEAPDEARFPALRLGRHVLETGGCAPIIFNAANEVAVQRFLKQEIGFLDIVRIVEQTLTGMPQAPVNSIEDVLEIDRQSRIAAHEY